MTDAKSAGSSAGGPPGGTLSLAALVCLVVGSMVGGGIFSLPQSFGAATGILGALIAWGLAGTGMLMLAFVFQALASRRPDIDAGIYGYAQAGFGPYAGFIAALSYWASAVLGNVAFLVLVMSTLGAYAPMFGDGDTLPALFGASALLWLFHVLLLRGVKEAAGINTIVTVAKLLPLAAFLLIVAFSARGELLEANFFGGESATPGAILDQVRQTMLVVVFVFLGIEGASVYSRLARRREDVGRATVLGFLGVLALFVLVTVLSYGVLPRAELAGLHNPSVAGVLSAVIGDAGTAFVSLGVLVSVLGAFLAWSLLAAEVLFSAARHGTMPRLLARENRAGAPAPAIWVSTLAAQFFLVLTQYAESAFRFFVDLTSITALIPYLFVAAFGLMLARRGETYEGQPRERRRDMVQAILATVCAVGLIYAGGLKLLLLSSLLFAPGTLLFVLVRREQGLALFTAREAAALGVIVLAALAAIWGLLSGEIVL
ncbi:MAG: amino acid permease [Rhizobiales bacterium]|nr:amino acid permease [Hyphomicrobiales bacterium]